MTLEETTYIAGLLEGEGYFLFNNGSLLAGVSMTDEDVIRKARSIIGSGTIIRRTRLLDRMDIFVLSVFGIEAIKLMKAIRPYMGTRRGQKIDLLLDQCEERITNKSEGKCSRGHDVTNPRNYRLNLNGSKQCKQCQIITAKTRKRLLKVV